MDKSKFQNKKEWRKFGIGLGIILLIIGTIQFILEKEWYYYFYGLSLIVFLSAAILPILLKPIFILSSYIGLTINWFVTKIILSFLLFFVFTSIGFLMRLLSKKPPALKIEKTKSSYWLKRKTTKLKRDDYEKQF